MPGRLASKPRAVDPCNCTLCNKRNATAIIIEPAAHPLREPALRFLFFTGKGGVRNSVAEHMRTRARHPLPDGHEPEEPAAEPEEDDRKSMRSRTRCITLFVAALPSPYREAVTLVELEGLTTREAADMVGISVSGMKSRVQRGREQLRRIFEQCCEIALDVRGKVTDFSPRVPRCGSCG